MAVRRARRFGQGEPPPVRGGSGGSSRGRAEPYIPFGWGKRPSSRSRSRDTSGSDRRLPSRSPIGVDRDYRVPATRGPGSFSGGIAGSSARQVEGWSAQGAGPGSVYAQGPRYWDGDEFGPAALGPAGIGELQAAMNAGGILDDFRHGIWDDSSRSAYKDLLTEANASGLTVEQALQNRLGSVSVGGSGGGSGSGGGGGGQFTIDPETGQPVFVEEQYVPPPLELRTTNKKDLARVFRAAVIDTLGQGWTQEQINEVVDAYVWEEMRLQTDAYHQAVEMERSEFMGERTAGGEIIANQTQPGGSLNIESPDTFLENKMIEEDPDAYGAGRVVNEAIPAFMQALNGWVGSGN